MWLRAKTVSEGFEKSIREQVYFDVDIGYIAYDVILIVNNSKRCNALIVHQFQGFLERFVATVRYKSAQAQTLLSA